jgi:hypothetical protein
MSAMDGIKRLTNLHDDLARSHPKLTRRQVWCRSCDYTRKVDAAECLRHGWPQCCGATMSIDAPGE